VYEHSADFEEVPTFEKKKAADKVEIDNDPVDLSTAISQDRKDAVAAAIAAAEAAAQEAANAEAAAGGLVVQKSRQDASITATMTVSHGWTIYEKEVEPDYWWWYIATDMADAILSDGEIFYQYATMIDQSSEYTEDPYTIGCAITKGTADTYTIQAFTHTTDPDTTGNLAYDADPSVVGQTWENQDSTEAELLSDTDWSAGTTHVGDNLAPESTDSLNSNFACYFAREYAKIGRNPNDFNKDFQVTIGARIYADSSATTFDYIPSPAAFTVTLTEPDSFYTARQTGAFSLFASTMAAVAMLFALTF